MRNLTMSELKVIKKIFEKEKVWYCGIRGVEFLRHGEWADPEIMYNGYIFNCNDLEDRLLEYYNETENNNITFEEYITRNKDLVFSELDDLIIEGYYKGQIK